MGGYNHYTYLLLNEKTDIDELEKKLKDFSAEFSKVSDKVSNVEYRWEIKLQPLAGIHLNSHLEFERETNGNMQDIYLMIGIIIMFMIISCFNYTNLLKLINEDRIQEFHVKKVFGASPFQLLIQNLVESLLFAAMAILLAGIMIKIVIAFGGSYFGIEFYVGRNYTILISILLTFIVTHLLFPAFLIVKSIALRFLDHNNLSENPGSKKGRFLAVPQFVISVILIAMAVTVNKQLEFLNEIDLGFSNDNVLTLSTHLPYGSYAEAGLSRLENSLRQSPKIKTISFSETIPGEKFERDGSFRFVEQPQENSKFCYLQMVSPSYFETFQIDILAGKSFSANRPRESFEVLVNESLAKFMNVSYEELIGREASIPFENEYRTCEVIGVVKDYYHQSMRNKIEPCAYLSIETGGVVSNISVRTGNVVGEERKHIMSLLTDSFESSFPRHLANLSYAKDIYEIQFRKDYQFSKIINTITLISIFMTVLGFIGLASNYARARTREVAIRKVYGANLNNIFSLFGAPYLKLIGITFVIAFPLSFYIVTLWLEYFIIKIDLGAWFAFWPIVIISAISLLSFSYYVTKVVIQDPIKILRDN